MNLSPDTEAAALLQTLVAQQTRASTPSLGRGENEIQRGESRPDSVLPLPAILPSSPPMMGILENTIAQALLLSTIAPSLLGSSAPTASPTLLDTRTLPLQAPAPNVMTGWMMPNARNPVVPNASTAALGNIPTNAALLGQLLQQATAPPPPSPSPADMYSLLHQLGSIPVSHRDYVDCARLVVPPPAPYPAPNTDAFPFRSKSTVFLWIPRTTISCDFYRTVAAL